MTLPTNRSLYDEAVETLRAAGDLYSFDDVINGISRGDMQSFANEETWVVAQVANFPQRRVLYLLLCVGTMEHFVELIPRLEGFAKSVGATRIMANARKGWSRALPTAVGPGHGWNWSYSGYYKELD